MTVYTQPGQPGGVVSYLPRYDNRIGGERVPPPPDTGRYFDNPSLRTSAGESNQPVRRRISCAASP